MSHLNALLTLINDEVPQNIHQAAYDSKAKHYCSIVFYPTSSFTIWAEVKNRQADTQCKHFTCSLPFFAKDFSARGFLLCICGMRKSLGMCEREIFPLQSVCIFHMSTHLLFLLPPFLTTRAIIHSSLIPLSGPSPLPLPHFFFCLNFKQIFLFTVLLSPCKSWLLHMAHPLCVVIGHFVFPVVKTARKVSG